MRSYIPLVAVALVFLIMTVIVQPVGRKEERLAATGPRAVVPGAVATGDTTSTGPDGTSGTGPGAARDRAPGTGSAGAVGTRRRDRKSVV